MDTTRIEKLALEILRLARADRRQKEEHEDTPTLFSMSQEEIPTIAAASYEIPEPIEVHTEIETDAKPRTRTWSKNPVRMRDEAVVAANKVGRAQGYCQRSDIERSLRRMNPDSSREDVRSAVNDAVAELGLTCIIFNSYRYYRRSDRGRILEISTARLREGDGSKQTNQKYEL